MGGKTALVIDDDVDLNELLCAVLKHAGFRAVAAFNGEDGLKKMVAFTPDIILLDIMMPDLDGIDVCRALRSIDESRNIPIIMVTAKTSLSDKLVGYIAGANRYITKPFDVEYLLREIEATMRQNETTKEMKVEMKP